MWIFIINVHVLIFEDALSFQKHVHALIRTQKIFQETRHALIFEYEMILMAKLSHLAVSGLTVRLPV